MPAAVCRVVSDLFYAGRLLTPSTHSPQGIYDGPIPEKCEHLDTAIAVYLSPDCNRFIGIPPPIHLERPHRHRGVHYLRGGGRTDHSDSCEVEQSLNSVPHIRSTGYFSNIFFAQREFQWLLMHKELVIRLHARRAACAETQRGEPHSVARVPGAGPCAHGECWPWQRGDGPVPSLLIGFKTEFKVSQSLVVGLLFSKKT